MATIRFKAPLLVSGEAGPAVVLTLPKDASAQLPSRGMVMVKGTFNDFPFRAALEPDGKQSHWFKVSQALLEGAGVGAGDTVAMEIEPTKEWPEPNVPADLAATLTSDPEAQAIWMDITPMARWDWIRWISAAKGLETR
jgi:hypothetical protein